MHIKCYHPPINIIHLGDTIYVPEDGVYSYTKKLYEKGIGHKTIPPQREEELQEFFSWKVRYSCTNIIFKRIIDLLMAM